MTAKSHVNPPIYDHHNDGLFGDDNIRRKPIEFIDHRINEYRRLWQRVDQQPDERLRVYQKLHPNIEKEEAEKAFRKILETDQKVRDAAKNGTLKDILYMPQVKELLPCDPSIATKLLQYTPARRVKNTESANLVLDQ